jgi:response regulator of citrate/malate metabolism
MKKIGNLDKLMADIAKLAPATKNENEFTVEEFVLKHNIDTTTSRRLLNQQVKQKALKMRKIMHQGRMTNAYSDYNDKD